MTNTLALLNKAEDVFTALDEALNEDLPPATYTALGANIARLLAEAAEMLQTASESVRGIYEPMFAEYRRMLGENPRILFRA